MLMYKPKLCFTLERNRRNFTRIASIRRFVLVINAGLLLHITELCVAETVFQCDTGEHPTYQNSPCSGQTEVKKIPIQPFKSDPATLDRLDQQRLDYLQKADPAEYNRIRRAQMTPDERLLDERLEAERLQVEKQALQQLQTQKQWQIQREILERQQQLAEQQAQQQRELEERMAQPQWQWRYLPSYHPHPPIKNPPLQAQPTHPSFQPLPGFPGGKP